MKSMLTACVLVFSAIAAQAADIGQLAWMSGDWVQQKGKLETAEPWIAPKGGTMLAINRSV